MHNRFTKFKKRAAIKNRRRIRKLKIVSRHPFAVPVFTFVFLIIASATAYAVLVDRDAPYRDASVVIIKHDHMEQVVPSVEPTVGALIKKLNITLGEGDVVEPALDTKINQDDFRINVYRALPVKIVDGATKTYALSAATTPRAIARQTGSELYAEDRVTADPVSNFLKDGAIGEQIVIDRATPVNVNLYGTPEVIRTHAATVGELVKEKGITLASNDQILPGPDTPLTANQQVFIAREGVKLQTVTENIAMPVQTILDTNLAYGTNAVRQQGAAGQRVVTYQIDEKTGAKSVIQSIVTQEAVTQIVVRGASLTGSKGDMARAGIAAGDFTYVDYIIEHESHWNPQARNASGAYGLCQALPGSKMASAGSDWASNPVTQLKWCSGYAKGRYGSWAGAYSYWTSHHYW